MSDPIASETSVDSGLSVAPDTSDDDWRRDLRIKLACAFVIKLALLGLLWFLFFRGAPS